LLYLKISGYQTGYFLYNHTFIDMNKIKQCYEYLYHLPDDQAIEILTDFYNHLPNTIDTRGVKMTIFKSALNDNSRVIELMYTISTPCVCIGYTPDTIEESDSINGWYCEAYFEKTYSIVSPEYLIKKIRNYKIFNITND
jgi:hypothetical protein